MVDEVSGRPGVMKKKAAISSLSCERAIATDRVRQICRCRWVLGLQGRARIDSLLEFVSRPIATEPQKPNEAVLRLGETGD